MNRFRRFWLEKNISHTEFWQLLSESKIGDYTPEETKEMFAHPFYSDQRAIILENENQIKIYNYHDLKEAFDAGTEYQFALSGYLSDQKLKISFDDWYKQKYK